MVSGPKLMGSSSCNEILILLFITSLANQQSLVKDAEKDDVDFQVYQRRGTVNEVLELRGCDRLDLNVLDLPLPLSPMPLPDSFK